MELLLRYGGDNYMVVDYYFAFLIVVEQLCINRVEYGAAQELEQINKKYVEMTKSSEEITELWILKIKRLIAQKDFNQAHHSII